MEKVGLRENGRGLRKDSIKIRWKRLKEKFRIKRR